MNQRGIRLEWRKLKRAIRLHSRDSIYSLNLVNGSRIGWMLQLGQMQGLALLLGLKVNYAHHID